MELPCNFMALFGKRKLKTHLEVTQEQERNKQEVSKFKKLRPNRVSSIFGGIDRFASAAIKRRKQQMIYSQQVTRPIIGSGKVSGRGRGRPRGSYDSRYAKYGGVYAYRKLLNASLRQQRGQQALANQLTPEQQQLLANLQRQQMANQANPENRVVPDTNGQVGNRIAFKEEIRRASHLVD